jgi:hypothetical protein
MAALTKDRATPYREGVELDYPVAANSKIYSGSLVCCNTSGYAVPGSDSPVHKFLGVALEQVDNTEGADGDKVIRLRRTGVFEFDAEALEQAAIGSTMYVVDDHTMSPASETIYDVRIGILVKLVSVTRGWVDISR